MNNKIYLLAKFSELVVASPDYVVAHTGLNLHKVGLREKVCDTHTLVEDQSEERREKEIASPCNGRFESVSPKRIGYRRKESCLSHGLCDRIPTLVG